MTLYYPIVSILFLAALLHCTLADLSPHPTAFWNGLNPATAAYSCDTGLVYSTSGVLSTTPVLFTIAPSDPSTILANTTLPLASDAPVACGEYVHVTVTDAVGGHTVLWTWNASTLALIRRIEMPYVLVVMACAEHGQVLLTARLGETMVAALRALDGERLAAWQMTGMSVRGVAVSEDAGVLYVLDAAVSAVRSVQVFLYASGKHLSTLPVPVTQATVTTIAVDPTCSYLYLLGAQGSHNAGFVYRLAVGDRSAVREGNWSLVALPITGERAFAAVVSPSMLLIPNVEHSSTLLSIDFTQPSTYSFLLVGQRPLLSTVTALAVDGTGYLYVAEKLPLQLLQLDGVDGRLIATNKLNNDTWCIDNRERPAAVAVDSKRQVYATLCDGRIGVFNQQQLLVDYILPLDYSATLTIVNTLYISRNRSQLYYTDMAFPHSIFRYDLTQRAVVQTWHISQANYDCFTVDERDQSIYACNNKPVYPTLDHLAANGTLLSSTPLLIGIAPTTSLAISYSTNQLIASVNTAVLGIDLSSGAVVVSYQYGKSSYAGSVAVDERTGRVYAMDEWNSGVWLFDSAAASSSDKQTSRRQKRKAVLRG